jgi:ribonuclease PH
LALKPLVASGSIHPDVFLPPVAAISVGIVNGQHYLDLCYEEDSNADVDVNVVMNTDGEFIEIQGSSEGVPFTRKSFDKLLSLAESGIREILDIQEQDD